MMRIAREFKCLCGACCWCASFCDACAHSAVIESPVGVPIGYIKQT